MSLTITLPRELEAKVQEAAARHGQNAEQYLFETLEQALKRPKLDEILAPVREQFATTGLTEEQLTALVKEERRAMWREKHGDKM
jgi:plasmid stability protein